MFRTIGNTLTLMRASWQVLNQDRRLLWFPIMSGVALLAIFAVALGVFSLRGTVDEGSQMGAMDYVVGVIFYLLATFIVIYFNSALISAAYVRLQGGTPTVGSALQVANGYLPEIFGWACFSTTIGLLIEQLRSGDGLVFKIIGWVLASIWAYMTYFVVPVLVLEGLSPFDALKRSSALFNQTWGKQAVSNFGFGLLYIAVVVVAGVPLILALSVSTAVAIVVGLMVSLPVVVLGFAALVAMEGIFRTALYQFATTGKSSMLPDHVMRSAYVDKNSRGDWGGSISASDSDANSRNNDLSVR